MNELLFFLVGALFGLFLGYIVGQFQEWLRHDEGDDNGRCQ